MCSDARDELKTEKGVLQVDVGMGKFRSSEGTKSRGLDSPKD